MYLFKPPVRSISAFSPQISAQSSSSDPVCLWPACSVFPQTPRHTSPSTSCSCKNTSLTLAHLSQLLGYSRIAQPLYSFLISSAGISPALLSLLQNYQRYDVLEYHWEEGRKPRNIIVAEWEKATRNLNWHTVIGGAGI